MSRAVIIFIGLLALAILGYFCIYKGGWTDIQNDVDTRTHAALADQDMDHIAINTNGRDIILTGEVASKTIKQQAEDHAMKVHGVRTVDNQLLVAASAPELNSEPIPEPEPEPIVEPVEEIIQTPEQETQPENTCQQDFNALLGSNQINFATNSADIDSSSNNLLSELVDVANQCSEANIEVAGHTDSRGSDDYNLRLSQSRASSVMSYLIDNGIDADRLSAVGYGETRPIADNESKEGLAKNRRIEFNVKVLSQ